MCSLILSAPAAGTCYSAFFNLDQTYFSPNRLARGPTYLGLNISTKDCSACFSNYRVWPTIDQTWLNWNNEHTQSDKPHAILTYHLEIMPIWSNDELIDSHVSFLRWRILWRAHRQMTFQMCYFSILRNVFSHFFGDDVYLHMCRAKGICCRQFWQHCVIAMLQKL